MSALALKTGSILDLFTTRGTLELFAWAPAPAGVRAWARACAHGYVQTRARVGKGGRKNFKKAIASESGIWDKKWSAGIGPAAERDSKMVDFQFKLPKAFPDAGKVMRTLSITRGGKDGADWLINGHVMPQETVDHAVAFAVRQRLANSFASAGSLEKDGKPLSWADREKAFGDMYDAVLKKLYSRESLPSWESVFIGGETLSPFESQMARLVSAGLREWAKAKGKKLPKVASDEYKELAAKYRAKFKGRLESEAQAALDSAAEDADDFDDFLSDSADEKAE